MSENDALYLAQEFLARMGSGAEPAEIASCLAKTWSGKQRAVSVFCPGSRKIRQDRYRFRQ
jgi:hypothetical protein